MPAELECPFNQFRHILSRVSLNSGANPGGDPEQDLLIREMIRLTEAHDPMETGQHVQRVAACSARLYREWALRRELPEREIRTTATALKTAALFHDIGKTAISSMILKTSRRLKKEEYNLIKYHTLFGASLFRNSPTLWGQMARDICLNHHEKWDGSGYPGNILSVPEAPLRHWAGKRGTDIPLSARIVALADVYDALSSPRSYKRSWGDQQIIRYFRQHSGRHFDPQLVDIFLDEYPRFKSLRIEVDQRLSG